MHLPSRDCLSCRGKRSERAEKVHFEAALPSSPPLSHYLIFFELWKAVRRNLTHRLWNILLLIPRWKNVWFLFFCHHSIPYLPAWNASVDEVLGRRTNVGKNRLVPLWSLTQVTLSHSIHPSFFPVYSRI